MGERAPSAVRAIRAVRISHHIITRSYVLSYRMQRRDYTIIKQLVEQRLSNMDNFMEYPPYPSILANDEEMRAYYASVARLDAAALLPLDATLYSVSDRPRPSH